MIGAGRDVRGGVSSVVNSYYEAGLANKVDLTYLPTMEDGSKLHKLIVAAKAYARFGSLLKKCDILHVHMSVDASFYRKAAFIRRAHKAGKKIVIHMHGSTFDSFYLERCNEKQKANVREIFGMADRVIALSQDWKRFIDREVYGSGADLGTDSNPVREWEEAGSIENACAHGIVGAEERRESSVTSNDRVIVIYNSVNIPAPYKKDYANRNMLFLGLLGHRKGTYDLIEVLSALLNKYPDAHMYFGGDGERQQAEALYHEKGISDRVTFLGWVRGANKEKYLKDCSIYVLPTYHEGMPMSVLEAMAYGLVVDSTYVGGIPHIIRDGENGLLQEAGDTDALSANLDRLLADADLRRALGTKAVALIREDFDVAKNLEKLLALYHELI